MIMGCFQDMLSYFLIWWPVVLGDLAFHVQVWSLGISKLGTLGGPSLNMLGLGVCVRGLGVGMDLGHIVL